MQVGYCVSITSWENDADNYQTHTIDGLTKEEARSVVDIAHLFVSKNGKPKGYGNYYDDAPWADISNDIKAILVKNGALESLTKKYSLEFASPIDDDDDDCYYDICDMISEFFGNTEFATRVYDGVAIKYISQPSTKVTYKELCK